jgi:hypothetical protein
LSALNIFILNQKEGKDEQAGGINTLLCYFISFYFFLSLSHAPFSLSLSQTSVAGAVAVRPDGGATAPEPQTTPKLKLFYSKPPFKLF